ncbi:MAG TPA: hypothetical protein VD994_05165 [Prosthecobacter sp.]|nr:hypothetical protein [Prosthecobacter sp.]
MKLRLPAFMLILLGGALAAQPQPALVPYQPTVIQDKKNNEWYIEQNGGLQRNGSAPSIISSAMTLHLGAQQFYSQQPMISLDGKELVMAAHQPISGLSVTRRITILEKEGALRYVEELTNTTGRDIALPLELRHNFNNPKEIVSDAGRLLKDALQAGESGVMVVANAQEKSPNVLLTLCAPGTAAPPRITPRNGYQLSVFYNLTIPAGQTVTVIHGITQARVATGAGAEEVAKAFAPIHMRRLTRDLTKSTLKAAANITAGGLDHGLADWFPSKYWDVEPGSSDILVVDTASHLKGRSSAAPAMLTTTFGKVNVVWENVAALAGPVFTQTSESWVWLRDGQRWKGNLDFKDLKFTLTAGVELAFPRLNRLVLRQPADQAQSARLQQHMLLETWAGERLAVQPEGALRVDTPWGAWEVPWSEIVTLSPAGADSLGGMLSLRDGTRLRVLPAPVRVTLNTKDFGPREFDLAQLRRAITPLAASAPAEDTEPAVSFIDLAGGQRLIARVTSETLRFLTPSGPVELTPATVRELHEPPDEDDLSSKPPSRFQAEIWGGGTLIGSLDHAAIKVEGRGFSWDIPVRHLARIVNPVPVADTGLMRRTGELIQALGDPQWKTRERATSELRELGPLARPSLQEALKQSTDPEVTRRLETLLSELD